MSSEQHLLLLIEHRNGKPLREPVHAEQVGPGMFRLLHSPGFVQGIAAGDEFRLTGEDGAFEVTHRSGNLAIQLFSDGPVAPLRGELAERVTQLGGWLDGGFERVLVFSIPLTAGFPAIEAVFDGWVAEHPDWEWSFGNVNDPSGEPAMLAIWDRVRQLEGSTLATLYRDKSFTVVSVNDDCVRVIPDDGNGSERPDRRERIEYVAGLRLPREELRRRALQEYPNDQNTSYIAAIVYEVSKSLAKTTGVGS